MNTSIAWAAFALSLLILVIYELRAHHVGQNNPAQVARYANARVRMHWVTALSSQSGFEIVAVQTLRNSLMSATISASTAALGVMGAVSLAGASLVSELPHLNSGGVSSLHVVLQGLLVVTLFSSYVCSAMAMRYYSHTGFIMSMPVASPERQVFISAAADYVRRAGMLYSWGLRLFLMAAPIIAGVVHPLAMPVATCVLLVALFYFDQPAASVEID